MKMNAENLLVLFVRTETMAMETLSLLTYSLIPENAIIALPKVQ
jgi:hypothetical protein